MSDDAEYTPSNDQPSSNADEFEQPSYVVEENVKESLDDRVDEVAEQEAHDQPIQKTKNAMKKLTKDKLIEEFVFCDRKRKDAFWRSHNMSMVYMSAIETLRAAICDDVRILDQFNGINTHKYGFFACQKCGNSFEGQDALQQAVTAPCGDLYCKKCLDEIQSVYGNCLRCNKRTTRMRYEIDVLGEIEAEPKKKKKK